jgi:hypothetical protein
MWTTFWNLMSLKSRIAKARARLFGTAARDVPVPFELECDCGQRVTGIRRPSYQIAECSSCLASLYVLPVNVYPMTKRVRSEVVDGPLTARVGTVVRELVAGDKQVAVDTDESTSDGDLKSSRGRKRRSRSAADSEDVILTAVAVPLQTADGTAIVAIPKRSVRERLQLLLSPTRIIAVMIVGILLVTGWWMIEQRRYETARRVWRQEMDRVAPALKERDLGTLYEALTKATAAAAVMQRDDAESREASSLLLQTEAVLNLSSVDLVGQLSEAFASKGGDRVTQAAAASESLVGQWLVFESALRSGSDSHQVELDLPLVIQDGAVRITSRAKVLSEYARANAKQPTIFCARIRSVHSVPDAGEQWHLELDSADCVLLTTTLHAETCGLDPQTIPELADTLKRQAEFMRTVDPGTLSQSTEVLLTSDQEKQQ